MLHQRDAVRGALRAAREQSFPRSILEQPHIRPYHEDFGARAGDAGVIAETHHGRPLGAAWVRQVDGYGWVDADTPELGIAVVPEARGTGIGTALLSELFAVVPRCSISVDTRNAALRLYERVGFETVRAEGDHTLVMLHRGEPASASRRGRVVMGERAWVSRHGRAVMGGPT